MWSLVVVLVLCLNVSVHTHWFERGDLCETWKGTKGSCRHYLNCPTAVEGVQADGPLEICDFEGIYPKVCCEVYNLPTSAPLIFAEPEYGIIQNSNTYPNFQYSVGGRNAEEKEFPHMALLGYGELNNVQWRCGGSLISKEFVLTAAHCLLTGFFGELRYIRIGELDYSTTIDKAEPQDFTVRETYPHPYYTPSSFYHDIALVRLDRPVRMSDYVKPACLGFTKNPTNQIPLAMGWGSTSYGGPLATFLQVVALSFVSNEVCRSVYGIDPRYNRGIDENIQICADGGGFKRDTCEGDSGGPLQIRNFRKNCQEIVGVIAFGKGCAIHAGVYTRVYPYTSWITALVGLIE